MANDETPYIAIDTMTDETVGRYKTLFDAAYANKGKPVDISYKPRKRIAKKKEFPYQ